MAAQISRVDVFDALPYLVGGAAEADARGATRVSGRLVEIAIGVGDEIDARDEESEMQLVAVLVHCGGRSTARAGAHAADNICANKIRSEKNAARPIGESKSI